VPAYRPAGRDAAEAAHRIRGAGPPPHTGPVSPAPGLVPELDVTSVSSSLRFYEGVLGFAVAYARLDEGFAYLERPGAHLMIQRAEGPGRRFRTAPLDRPHGRGVNVQLEVPDVASVRDQVVSLGYELVVDLEDRWYRADQVDVGHRQLVVADPDGYLWRPFQPLGGAGTDTALGRRRH
jgi:catechol 2,3-dioxygenase-like lactoylglutathione lyase family enzyme